MKNNKYKIFSFSTALLMTVFVVSYMTPIKAEYVGTLSTKTQEARPQQLIIKFANDPQPRAVTMFSSDSTEQILKDLEQDPDIEYAEENTLFEISIIPNDPFFHFQEYLEQIKAPNAWDITAGSSNIVIAILDTGIDIDNPDLRGNIWKNTKEIKGNGIDDDNNGYIDDINGWNFVEDDADVQPHLSSYTEIGLHHGTIIAGIAAARGGNKQGVSGVSWRSHVMPIRVLANDGVGTALSVVRGIDYAIENGADIINLSFVGNKNSRTLEAAIERAFIADIPVVAAAGNEVLDGISMDAKPRYPVCNDGPNGENWVIGVASVDKNDRKANFSNYGNKCIDLTAPGIGIFSTLYHDENTIDYLKAYGGLWSGTSISAPQVSGALALIKSLRGDASLIEMRNILKNNLDNIDDKNAPWAGKLGSGRLNLSMVVRAAFGVGGRKVPLAAEGAKAVNVTAYPGKEKSTAQYSFKGDKTGEIYLGNIGIGAEVIEIDINNDGINELIVTSGLGEKPWIKIINKAGHVQSSWLAYAPGFRGGVRVAVGDIDGDGTLEIISTPQSRGGPHVRVFSTEGRLKFQFFAFNKAWRGGLFPGIGDVNGDGLGDIVIGIGSGSTPVVRVFNAQGIRISQFIAYNMNFFGGVRVAVDDIDRDGKAEIITAPGPGGGPHVRVLDYLGNVETEFFAYDKNFRGGVRVSTGDVDRDGRMEIVTSPGPGGGPHIRIFNHKTRLESQFFALNEHYRGGIIVSVER